MTDRVGAKPLENKKANQQQSKWTKTALVVLAGFLWAIAFSVPYCGFLAWFGAAPFFYVLLTISREENLPLKKRAKQCFCFAFLFGLAYFLPSLSWFFALQPLGEMNVVVSFLVLTLAWLILGGLLSLGVGCLGLGFAWLQGGVWKMVFYCSLAWFLLEQAASCRWFFGGFPWVTIGVSQYQCTWLLQAANLIGAMGLSACIVAVNVCLAWAWRQHSWQPLAGGAAVLLCLVSYSGVCLLNQPALGAATAEVAVVHSGNALEERWDSKNDKKILSNYLDLSYAAAKDCQEHGKPLALIVWPETALPYSVNPQNVLGQTYLELAQTTGADLLIGGYHNEGEKTYNTIFSIMSGGVIKDVYYKQKLVPFGECTPCEDLLRHFLPDSFFDSFPVGNLEPGQKQGAVVLTDTQAASLICYDSIFSNLLVQPVREGAELIAISSNEGWYAHSLALRQHFAHGVLRAVEQNRSVLRSTNGGYSAIINNQGQLLALAAPQQNTYLQAEIPLLSEKSVFCQIGWLLPWLAVAGLLFILVGQLMVKK